MRFVVFKNVLEDEIDVIGDVGGLLGDVLVGEVYMCGKFEINDVEVFWYDGLESVSRGLILVICYEFFDVLLV